VANWSYRDRPDVFVNIPVEQAAARVGALIERYRPAVVVTYDPHTTPGTPYREPGGRRARPGGAIGLRRYLPAHHRWDKDSGGQPK
jgi:hypothetical protein